MMVVIGTLYQDSATRLCNAYRLDDQQDLGLAIVWLALGVVTLWLGMLTRERRPPRGAPVPHA